MRGTFGSHFLTLMPEGVVADDLASGKLWHNLALQHEAPMPVNAITETSSIA
ncbi:hypothetical protein [Cupriavidus necator]|uniref:hypothetical protein n=1 Tax=Cupriavidus necator TaxID=106590 RepID=UPI0012D2FA8D|nr:hypothetical protein [Cupriavidus necator]